MRFQNILGITRDTLNKLNEVHAGNIILTPELQEAGDSIYDSRTPRDWLYDMGLNEISWVINNLGAWFTGL
jgi:hypothetical protein